jgi:hypothetical protein
VLTVRALAKIGAATGTNPAGDGGPRYYYDFAPACQGNAAGGDALCGPAVRICRNRDRTALLYYIFRGTDPAVLSNVGTVCLGSTDFVDRATLDRDVLAELMRRLPLTVPRIMTAPADSTLVHLPTVFWAVNPSTGQPDEPQYAVSGTVDDVSVSLQVSGTWTWQLADGHGTRMLHTSGTPYVAGVTPDPRTDSAYYTSRGGTAGTGLVATYDSRGTIPIRLTVTWTPTYSVDYEVGTTDLDTAAVAYTVVRQLRVGEARAVLVSAGGGSH